MAGRAWVSVSSPLKSELRIEIRGSSVFGRHGLTVRERIARGEAGADSGTTLRAGTALRQVMTGRVDRRIFAMTRVNGVVTFRVRSLGASGIATLRCMMRQNL